MPLFESPSLYIDFSQFAPPPVIETIDYEKLLTTYRQQVVAKNPALARAVKLEQSSTNVILQAEAYGEMMVRARINDAARALMLPFATGPDLDVLGALQNCARDSVTNADGTITAELDDRYRRRIQLTPEAYNTAGSEGAYIWQALKADPTIRDVSATLVNKEGRIAITVMNSGADPTPTQQQITNVIERLHRKEIKPLTDDVAVQRVDIVRRSIKATVSIYPGPDPATVVNLIKAALSKERSRLNALGRSFTLQNVARILDQEGVQDVDIEQPTESALVNNTQCALITEASISLADTRRF